MWDGRSLFYRFANGPLFNDNIVVSAIKLLLCLFDLLAEKQEDDQIRYTVDDQADPTEAKDRFECAEGDDAAEDDKERRDQ